MTTAVFITGVSSGIGLALAQQYLDQGRDVYGVSRRRPIELMEKTGFRFASVDLSDHDATRVCIVDLLQEVDSLEMAILNAGVLSPFGDLADSDLARLQDVMEVNVWANKTVIDALYAGQRSVQQVIAISSGASVSGNRGWNGYAISKAALNMLVKLYAAERPETYFCALAPGTVDTAMQDELCALPADSRFATLEVLRSKRGTDAMPRPVEAARRLIETFSRLPQICASGDYADVRKL